MEKREALKIWTIFLAIMAFSFSLLGTFLVRSGVLTSVHSFASDPTRGIVILAILVFFIAGSLSLFAWRASILKQGGLFAPISREGALVVNNLLLTTACATVLFGTLYPLALEQITGDKITVGAPFFNMTCGVILLALAFLAPFGYSLAWKRGDLLGVVQRLGVALLAGLTVTIALLAIFRGGPVLAPIAAGVAVLVMLGTLSEILSRVARGGFTVSSMFSRAGGLPLSFWGGAIAHFAVGVALLGLAATGFGAETVVNMREGVPVQVGPFEVVMDSVTPREGPNYQELVATMSIRSAGALVATVEPARRQFATRQMGTTQAGIVTLGLGQVYIAISDPEADGQVPARLYWKPWVTLIWLGACLMALGGFLSLADRRLRFGAPARSRALADAAATAVRG
jgi:cytochrome c-type biogenesis protein CcmF